MTRIKAILPATGLGTRFLPATKAIPKEMLPLVDKPLIQYAIDEAKQCGIDEFLIITGKNKRSIADHLDVAIELEHALKLHHKEGLLKEINVLDGLHFAFIGQGNAVGLGGTIRRARPFVGNDSFAVILSDDVIMTEETPLKKMLAIHEKTSAPVIALEEVRPSDVSGHEIIRGKEVSPDLFEVGAFVENPRRDDAPSNLAVIGRYVLTPDLFSILENTSKMSSGELRLTDALNTLASKRKVYGHLFSGKRYDARDKLGFIKATIDCALGRPELAKPFREYIQRLAKRLEDSERES